MGMKFKESFMELKKPIVWLHYLLGAAGIWAIFSFLFKLNMVAGITGFAIFLAIYILADRTSHAILGFN
jgi:hypothetical protein